jgi:hypothetical protein
MNDKPEEVVVQPTHVDHSVEVVSQATPTGHKWVQRGVYVQCEGGFDHYRHGFIVEPHLVLREVKENGELVFEDVRGKEPVTVMPEES